MRRALTKSLALPGLALLLALPSTANAYPFFSSSMVAQCMTLNCSTLRFTLDVAGDQRMFAVGVQNLSANLDFTAIQSIKNSLGEEANWWTNVFSFDRWEAEWAVGAGFPASEPIGIYVTTTGLGMGEVLSTGDMSYAGLGCQGTSDCANLFQVGGSVTSAATAGTVTPEPQTVILLAIGLALLGGVVAVRHHA